MSRQKYEYYSLKRILEYGAKYNVIFGERSNGKTYAVQLYALEKYVKNGEQLALVRRYEEDFTGKRGVSMFNNIVTNGEVTRLTGGEYNNITYYASKWYLSYTDPETGKTTKDETPFCTGFAISGQEHDKSTGYPKITTIMFDEFLTRSFYLPDEFVLFCNTLSTIIRLRTDVTIFMLGNTVNKYCPYFAEMGLTHAKSMEPGTIDLYRYGDTELTVAVEHTKPNSQGKPSDYYFAFNNPKLNMITKGEWELEVYPHCPIKYRPMDIKYTYFIQFDKELLQCEIVKRDNNEFTFIHRKTTPLKGEEKDLIYSTVHDSRPNWRRRITKPYFPVEKIIARHFITDKVFYQDNEVGEIVRNYLIWCKSSEI